LHSPEKPTCSPIDQNLRIIALQVALFMQIAIVG